MSDVLLLSRFQFAITIFYHFLFVPLTIGLVILVACMETQYARTLNPTYR
ncbi:cytochrome ubiquinol oxidase subunit I, partial [Vibrio parahaemolyticus]|nr:cytochrome ubiquinol oxidase subunit I [Vibrio parahaemolyticus]